MRKLAPTLALGVLAALSGCYTPAGRFVTVETYQQSNPPGYVIAPGDVLQVRVFQQEPLSSRVKVRPDGRLSLPLVNEVDAAGKTPTQLSVELQDKFRSYINSPIVTVSLEEGRPLTVSVLGEVARPGVVTLDSGAGLMQALAAAGGLSQFAHRDGLFVLRTRVPGTTPQRIRFTWDALARGDAQAANFTLSVGDVVVAE